MKLRIEDHFDKVENAPTEARELHEEIQENVDDLAGYALHAAPWVMEGHEDAPLEQIVAAAIITGFYVGWKMKGELDV